MNRKFLASVVLGWAMLSGTAAWAEPHDVWDYYMLLPKDYFEVPNREQLFKDMRGTLDKKNGYLKMDGDGAQHGMELGLFKRTHGDYLLAAYLPPMDEPQVFLDFFKYENGKLVKQNWAKIMPVKFDENLLYKIPRTGTDIVVTKPNGKKLYVLKWNGEKFQRTK